MKQYFNVPVRMRDGILLSTDIRLPDAGGPYPTLVRRTPYGQVNPDDRSLSKMAQKMPAPRSRMLGHAIR